MKKRIFTGLVLGAMMMGALTGCGEAKDVEPAEKKSANTEVVETVDGIEYNICQSPVFTEDEMMYGAEYVIAAFGTHFPECELLSVTYDDRFSSAQDEINQQQYGDADYVVFTTDFTVPADYTDGPLNAGETYEDYQWILTMNVDGHWELVSSGY